MMGLTAQKLFLTVLLVGPAGGLSGCAHWSPREPTENELENTFGSPSATLGANRVVLEVAHVSIVREDLADLEDCWREIDEHVIDAALRKRLNENGVRVGRIGGELPAYLRDLVDQPKDIPNLDDATQDRLKLHRLTMTAGNEKDMPVGTPQENLSLLRNEGGAIRGKTLHDAQCMMSLRAENETSAGTLFFRPWIVYGPVKQTYTGKDGAWRIAPEREQIDFPDLHFSTPLAPGETLVIAPGQQARGVGKLFFHKKDESRRILLVRLSSSQGSPLFQSSDILAPPISSLAE
jgi:hypothetical protein